MSAENSSVDIAEVAKFEAMAARWWDPNGPARPLHLLGPARLDYIADQVCAEFGRDRRALRPFEGLDVIDVGCGGGLVTEPMARLGATVVGIDAAAASIEAARSHASQGGLTIDYRATTAEALVTDGEVFDVVLALEIVEHVSDQAAFLKTCAALVRPGGMMILSTLNRTAASFALAIVGAEYVLGWLDRGTHDWRRFVTPDDVATMWTAAGLQPVDSTGMVLNPRTMTFALSPRDLSVNYIATALKPA
ncbi:MAG: bifunctional 2-polyprenyl-6-hydroxyphenol methylase/3-demethylubiquinol 3-O-methyltransferase UbiG [Pseudomonadota bacterium]